MPVDRRIFIDSNIVLYALGDELPKRQTAWQLLFQSPTISVQVLNECSNILVRKRNVDKSDVRTILEDILQFTHVENIGLAVVQLAWDLMGRYRYSYFDSLILASSLSAECQILYSEDMQHAQVIEGRLTIVNPFIDY